MIIYVYIYNMMCTIYIYVLYVIFIIDRYTMGGNLETYPRLRLVYAVFYGMMMIWGYQPLNIKL
jgi:hypothetical protein